MSTPPEPVVLAEQGHLVVAERGPDILVIDRGGGPSELTAFLLVAVTLICGGFGAVSMFYAVAGALAARSVVIGAVLLAVGVAAGFAMVSAVRAVNRNRVQPLTAVTPVAVFDRRHRVYRDGSGEIVAALDEVRFECAATLTSSLVVVTPSGTRVLKRGRLFGGGYDMVARTLSRVVHGV